MNMLGLYGLASGAERAHGHSLKVQQSRGVIVYLTQARHSSYPGRDCFTLLKKSVTLLFHYYNRRARDDVLFLQPEQEQQLTSSQQEQILTLCAGSP